MSKKEKTQEKPPVDKKVSEDAPPVITPEEVASLSTKAEQEAPPEVKEPLTLKEITEALGTMQDARQERKILQDRAATAKALEEEERSLANTQTSQIRRAESKSRYLKSQTELLENERLMAEENELKAKRDAVAKEATEKEAAAEKERLAAEVRETEEFSKAFRDAGEYEPLKGEQFKGVYLERSALDIGSVGVILRITPLEKKGGAPTGIPQHLFIPNVKPSGGILRRSVR